MDVEVISPASSVAGCVIADSSLIAARRGPLGDGALYSVMVCWEIAWEWERGTFSEGVRGGVSY